MAVQQAGCEDVSVGIVTRHASWMAGVGDSFPTGTEGGEMMLIADRYVSSPPERWVDNFGAMIQESNLQALTR